MQCYLKTSHSIFVAFLSLIVYYRISNFSRFTIYLPTAGHNNNFIITLHIIMLSPSIPYTVYTIYIIIFYNNNTKQRKCKVREAGSGGAVTIFGAFLSLKLKIPALLDIAHFIVSSTQLVHMRRKSCSNTRTAPSRLNVSDQWSLKLYTPTIIIVSISLRIIVYLPVNYTIKTMNNIYHLYCIVVRL